MMLSSLASLASMALARNDVCKDFVEMLKLLLLLGQELH